MADRTMFELKNSLGWPIRGDIRHVPGTQPRGIVVVAHGFKGFKDWGHFPLVSERIAESGFIAVSFNFSGSGIGEDPMEFTELDKFKGNTLSLEIEDLHCVIDYATNQNPEVARRMVALLGHSRGAVSVLHAATTRPDVSCAVAWAGVGVLDDRYPASLRAEWRRRGSLEVTNSRTGQVLEIGLTGLDDLERHLEDYDPVRMVQKLLIPVLLVHGTGDSSVPIGESEAVAAASPRVKLLRLEGADHTFGAVHPFRGATGHLDEALTWTLDFLKMRRT